MFYVLNLIQNPIQFVFSFDRQSLQLAYVKIPKNSVSNFFLSQFVGCSFATCAIWQYEAQRRKLSKVKERWQSKEKSKPISSQVLFLFETIYAKKNSEFLVDEYLERCSRIKTSGWSNCRTEFDRFSCLESEQISTVVIEILYIESFQTYDSSGFCLQE